MNKKIDDLKAQLTRVKEELGVSLNSIGTSHKRGRPEDSESNGDLHKQPRLDQSTSSSSTGFILVSDSEAPDLSNGTSGSSQKTLNAIEVLQQRIADHSSKLTALMENTQEAKQKLQEAQDSVQCARAMLNAFCAAERSKVCLITL